MTIQDWPHSERPREKLIQKGVGSLSDAELQALFLQTGRPGQSAVDVARELLLEFGGLRSVLMADQATFCAQPGMGPARYALLQASLEVSRRHVYCEVREYDAMTSPGLVREYLSLHLSGLQHEVFAGVLVKSNHSSCKPSLAYSENYVSPWSGGLTFLINDELRLRKVLLVHIGK